jgi:hypothetical protein
MKSTLPLLAILLYSEAYYLNNNKIKNTFHSISSSACLKQSEEDDILNEYKYEYMDASDLPEDVRNSIQNEQPSDIDVRMSLMGVTPFTAAGFGLAFTVFILNNMLGTGWASNLLMKNSDETVETLHTPMSVSHGSPYIDKTSIKSFTLDGKDFELR